MPQLAEEGRFYDCSRFPKGSVRQTITVCRESSASSGKTLSDLKKRVIHQSRRGKECLALPSEDSYKMTGICAQTFVCVCVLVNYKLCPCKLQIQISVLKQKGWFDFIFLTSVKADGPLRII